MCVYLKFLFCFALFVLVTWHLDAIAGMKKALGTKLKCYPYGVVARNNDTLSFLSCLYFSKILSWYFLEQF